MTDATTAGGAAAGTATAGTTSTGSTGTGAATAAGDDGKGGKDAVLADLAKERDQRQALQQTVEQMKADQAKQAQAMAAAFGLKPEETSVDALAAQVKQMQTDLATSRTTSLRQQVALDKRLPPELAARLVGTTEQELAADADALLELMGNGAPSYDGGTRTSASGPVDMNQAIRDRLNRP